MVLQMASVFLGAVVMALSLAHALDLPEKLRLDKDTLAPVSGAGPRWWGLLCVWPDETHHFDRAAPDEGWKTIVAVAI
jgi:hypothetical protein